MPSNAPTTEPRPSRAEREANIRQHSEAYGMRVCIDHAHLFGDAIGKWRAGDASVADGVPVRAYNRAENAMYTTTLTRVLGNFTYDPKGAPLRLSPTPFGQVILAPTMHISTVLYHTLCAAWHLTARDG